MKIFLRTIGFLKERKIWVGLLIFLAVIQAGLSLVEPIFFREIIDSLSNSKNLDTVFFKVAKILLLWVAVSMVLMTIRILLTYFSDILVHKMMVSIWLRAIEKLLTLSIRFHNGKKVGSTMRRIERGSDNIFETNLDFLREDIPRIFALIFLVPLIFVLHFKMALALILIMPIILLLAAWSSLKTNKLQSKVEEKWTRASGTAYDAVANIGVVKSFTAFGEKIHELTKIIMSAHRDQLKVLKWWCFVIVLGKAATIIATISVFSFGAYLYTKNEITIGEIVMFSGFALLIVNHVESGLWHFQRFLWRKHKLGQFFEIWDEEPEIKDKPDAKDMPSVDGNVEFKKVTFSHDGDIEALKNISFFVEKGETVALVGHTGSGKTTTVNLISRFFDIQKGQILIDNFNIKNVTQDSLRKNIGMVFQENTLFHSSILNNLKIGNLRASFEDVKKACKIAHAHEFINKFPQKYNTVVGERGIKLSGGEKQRVAIARALLKNPPILVLDEATSALDAETENKIQDALAKLIKGRTTFIVAHRLSTIKKVDKILVFDKGKIIEQGTFNSLMRKKGSFSNLVHAQVSGFIV